MNIGRLNHLITILEGVEARNSRFHLNSWANLIAPDGTLIEDSADPIDFIGEGAHACGTSACACGYAGLDPDFQAEGLSLTVHTAAGGRWRPGNAVEFNALVRAAGRDAISYFHAFVEYDGQEGWDAIEAFFDISYNTALRLFGEENYEEDERASPRAVIERIKQAIA
jgi:hypothetical protein